MKVHLKVKEGIDDLIVDLQVLCGDKMKYNIYSSMIELEIDTSYEADLGCIFSEKHYDNNDYRLCVYKRSEHSKEVNIPLDYIILILGL